MTLTSTLVAVTMAVAPVAGFAQQQQTISLSMDEAVQLAISNNPAYRRAQNDVRPAGWEVRNAYAAFLPSADASLGLNYSGAGAQRFLSSEFSQPSSTIGSNYSIGLNWSLSGTTLTEPGRARAAYDAAEANIGSARSNLAAEVVRLYLSALERRDELRIAELQLERNTQNLELVSARRQVGQATVLDVRQAEVARNRSELALVRQRQSALVETLRLFQQIGLPAPHDPMQVELADSLELVEPAWTLEALVERALAENPSLVALRANQNSANWRLKAARSSYLPTVSASASWSGFTQEFTNGDFQVTSAEAQAAASFQQCQTNNTIRTSAGLAPLNCGSPTLSEGQVNAIRSQNQAFPFDFTSQPFSARLTVSLPIFSNFNRPLRVSQASTQLDDMMEQVRETELLVRTEINQAYYAVQSAWQELDLSEENLVSARDQEQLASARYQVGSATIIELLDGQVAARQAEVDYVKAVYGYHNAIASLEAAVGRPLD